MNLRILFINDFLPSMFHGGAERLIDLLVTNVAKTGATVSVLVPAVEGASSAKEQAADVKTYGHYGQSQEYTRRASTPSLIDKGLARALEEIMRKDPPDIIHAHNVGYQSTQFLKRVADRTIFTIHDYWPFCLTRTLVDFAGLDCPGPRPVGCALCNIRNFNGYGSAMPPRPHLIRVANVSRMRNAAQIVAPSRLLLSLLVREGFPPGILRHIANGIDTHLFTPGRSARCSRVLFVGRPTKAKGLSLLLQAAATISDVDFELRVVGGAVPPSANRVSAIGRVSDEVLIEELRTAMCLVIPSLWKENAPMIALEAMACGTPVVAADVGGLPEIVEDGKNGFLFEPRNAQELADRLRMILESPELADTLGRQARETAVTKYDIMGTTSLYLHLYQEVIEGVARDAAT